MKLILKPNELILRAGNAKLYQNNVRIKGKLIIATETIYFRTLTEELQKYNIDLIYSNINEIEFFNTMWLIPNGLIIRTKDQKNISFLINNRNKSSNLITKMI